MADPPPLAESSGAPLPVPFHSLSLSRVERRREGARAPPNWRGGSEGAALNGCVYEFFCPGARRLGETGDRPRSRNACAVTMTALLTGRERAVSVKASAGRFSHSREISPNELALRRAASRRRETALLRRMIMCAGETQWEYYSPSSKALYRFAAH